jgi:hypothetical protein
MLEQCLAIRSNLVRMTFFIGFPFFVVIINLPLHFQIVNGNSPIMAGIRLIPMLGVSALGKL